MDLDRRKRNGGIGRFLFPVIFLCALFFLIFGSRKMEETAEHEQEDLLRQAINQAVVSCYAVEGRYPESLEYLEENYGVRIDREQYIATYEVFADNIKPQVRVKRIGE